MRILPMTKLPKYTLSHDQKREDWKLTNDATGRVAKRFETKADGTARGALRKAVGPEGASVRIEKEKGGYQEERTYPKNRDPKKTPG